MSRTVVSIDFGTSTSQVLINGENKLNEKSIFWISRDHTKIVPGKLEDAKNHLDLGGFTVVNLKRKILDIREMVLNRDAEAYKYVGGGRKESGDALTIKDFWETGTVMLQDALGHESPIKIEKVLGLVYDHLIGAALKSDGGKQIERKISWGISVPNNFDQLDLSYIRYIITDILRIYKRTEEKVVPLLKKTLKKKLDLTGKSPDAKDEYTESAFYKDLGEDGREERRRSVLGNKKRLPKESDEIHFSYEAEALVYQYLTEGVDFGEYGDVLSVVIDSGGGTTDFSFLYIEREKRFSFVRESSNIVLGGTYIDEFVWDRFTAFLAFLLHGVKLPEDDTEHISLAEDLYGAMVESGDGRPGRKSLNEIIAELKEYGKDEWKEFLRNLAEGGVYESVDDKLRASKEEFFGNEPSSTAESKDEAFWAITQHLEDFFVLLEKRQRNPGRTKSVFRLEGDDDGNVYAKISRAVFIKAYKKLTRRIAQKVRMELDSLNEELEKKGVFREALPFKNVEFLLGGGTCIPSIYLEFIKESLSEALRGTEWRIKKVVRVSKTYDKSVDVCRGCGKLVEEIVGNDKSKDSPKLRLRVLNYNFGIYVKKYGGIGKDLHEQGIDIDRHQRLFHLFKVVKRQGDFVEFGGEDQIVKLIRLDEESLTEVIWLIARNHVGNSVKLGGKDFLYIPFDDRKLIYIVYEGTIESDENGRAKIRPILYRAEFGMRKD